MLGDAQENKFFSAVLDADEDMSISYLEVVMYIYKNVPSLLNALIVIFLWAAGGIRLRDHSWFSLPAIGDVEDENFAHELDVLSVCSCLTWMNWLVVMLPFKGIGQLLLTIYGMLVGDVFRWMFIFLIFLGAFASGSYVGLIVSDRSMTDVFLTTTTSRDLSIEKLVYQFIYMSAGEVLPGTLLKVARNKALIHLYNLAFILFATIVLVNLLIGLMGATLTHHNSKGRQMWWLEFADLVLRYEKRLSKKQREAFRTGESVGDAGTGGCCEYYLVSVNRKGADDVEHHDYNDDDKPGDPVERHMQAMNEQIQMLNKQVELLTSAIHKLESGSGATIDSAVADAAGCRGSAELRAGLDGQMQAGDSAGAGAGAGVRQGQQEQQHASKGDGVVISSAPAGSLADASNVSLPADGKAEVSLDSRRAGQR
jgi:hypothetical protein